MQATPHADDDEARLRRCVDMCAVRGYQPAAVVRERPGEMSGLLDALRMVHAGEADRIVMVSVAELPDVLESATDGLPGHRRSDLHRRPRRLRP